AAFGGVGTAMVEPRASPSRMLPLKVVNTSCRLRGWSYSPGMAEPAVMYIGVSRRRSALSSGSCAPQAGEPGGPHMANGSHLHWSNMASGIMEYMPGAVGFM